jgi:hypothetical protein
MRGVGADGFINIDIACRTCGYDLRALSADAKCPECGTDVVGSLQDEQLSNADPAWVKQLSRGAQVIGLTLIAHLTLGCLTRGFAVHAGVLPRTIDVVCMIPWMIGVWMLTRPDPSGRGEREYGSLRRAWWGSAIAVAILDSADLALALRFDSTQIMPALQALSYGATAFIGLQFLSKIATRIADGVLVVCAKVLSVSFLVCYFLVAIGIGLGRTTAGWFPNTAVMLLVGLFILGFALSQLLYIGLLSRLSDRLRTQSVVARENTIVYAT